MHQVPTSNLLRELQEHCGVEVRVLACQTGPLPDQVSVGLSDAVQRAVVSAARWIMGEYLASAVDTRQGARPGTSSLPRKQSAVTVPRCDPATEEMTRTPV
jgi:hypothetical protein